MSLNLLRDAKVYMSTVNTGWTAADTWELKVLDGFSFSQSTSTQEVTLNEAGAAPNRGQKIFNTALDPVDFSFSTYVRPYVADSVATPGTMDIIGAGSTAYGDVSGLSVGTIYDLDVTIDGGSIQQLEIEVNGITIADAISGINAVLVGAYADLHAGEIRIVSNTTGASSVVLIETATGSAGTDFEVEYTGFSSFGSAVAGSASASVHTSAEKVLWDALTNNGTSPTPGAMNIDFAESNVHELPKFYLYIDVGEAKFELTEAIISSAEIDFSIDGIGMINWTGQASFYTVLPIPAVAGTDYPNPASDVTLVPVTASFLKNKLSTITMTGGPADTSYTLGLTAATITIDNGVTFLTPEELGEVNRPIGHFTGTRAISGNMTCYLDTDDNKSLSLLSDMLADVVSASPTITNSFVISLNMGGETAPYVSFEMPRAHIVIPAIESEDVISTSIDFTALGTGLTTTDEMTISYYAE